VRRDYDGLWARSKERLAAGRVVADRPPPSIGRRWGIAAVLRPSPEVASSLSAVACEISRLAGERQLVYEETNLHTTLCSIESRRLSGSPDEDRVRRYAEALREAAEKARPVHVSYRGLTASLSGVLAQGWPTDGSLQELRHAVYAGLEAQGLAIPEWSSPRRTAHATLVVFANPLHAPSALARLVEENRNTNFGACVFDAVELVRYDRTEHTAKLIPLARVLLPAD
jgi:2'-5' RNA ligase